MAKKIVKVEKKIIPKKKIATKSTKKEVAKKAVIKKAVKKVLVKKVIKKPVAKKAAAKLIVKKPVAKKPIIKKEVAKKTSPRLVIKKGVKEKKLGKVLHFYDKIKVLVIKLKDDVTVGDTVRMKGGKETDFKQKIVSMEIDGEKIKKAKKNQCIGFKVKEKVRPGYWVYKVED